MKEILFVSGVARSGTSALTAILNMHPDYMIGMERYFHIIQRNDLNSSHFERTRFVDVRDSDTHNSGSHGTIEQREHSFDKALFVGDKFPLLYKHFDNIIQKFPLAKHIYIVRNPLSVIESYDERFRDKNDNWQGTYKTGLTEWNNSIRKVLMLSPEHLERFNFLVYENFFSSTKNINDLFKRMGSQQLPDDKTRSFVEKHESLNRKLVARRDDIRMFAARNADWESYSKLLNIIEKRNEV